MSEPTLVLAIAVLAFFAGGAIVYALLVCSTNDRPRRRRWS
jgi:hypothetical protein